MIKGLKSVNLKIIQMYHFRLKWKRYMVCTNWWDSNFFLSGTPTFSSGTPTFCQMGVVNSCFQNPSESSDPITSNFHIWITFIKLSFNPITKMAAKMAATYQFTLADTLT